MNKSRNCTLIIILSLFLLSSPALANDLVVSPLFTHNLSPIIQIFGLPPTEGGQITPSGRSKLRLVMDIANNFSSDSSSDETLLFDGETSRLTCSLRHGFGDQWETGLDVPIISHQGGMLDGLIENWHKSFGLPQGGRDDAPRNQLHYSYTETDEKEDIDFSNSGTGLGDTSIYLAYQLNQNPPSVRRYIALRGGIKLPTGNSDHLRGSGGTDLHIRLAGSDGETLKNYGITLFSSVGLLWLGQGEILSDKQHRTVGFGSLGLGWAPLNYVTFKIQIDGHSAFMLIANLNRLILHRRNWPPGGR